MLPSKRWVFAYTEGEASDDLIHVVISDYATPYYTHGTLEFPLCGITQCGTLVGLYRDTPGHCVQGTYVPDDTLVTCIRCMSGVCLDGIRLRQDRLYSRKGAPVIKGYGQIRGYAASQIYIDEIGTPSKKP